MKLLNSREERFRENEETLLSNNGFKLKFPSNMHKFPTHLREIFEFYKQTIRGEDLILLQKGELSSESITILYYKFLKKST